MSHKNSFCFAHRSELYNNSVRVRVYVYLCVTAEIHGSWYSCSKITQQDAYGEGISLLIPFPDNALEKTVEDEQVLGSTAFLLLCNPASQINIYFSKC